MTFSRLSPARIQEFGLQFAPYYAHRLWFEQIRCGHEPRMEWYIIIDTFVNPLLPRKVRRDTSARRRAVMRMRAMAAALEATVEEFTIPGAVVQFDMTKTTADPVECDLSAFFTKEETRSMHDALKYSFQGVKLQGAPVPTSSTVDSKAEELTGSWKHQLLYFMVAMIVVLGPVYYHPTCFGLSFCASRTEDIAQQPICPSPSLQFILEQQSTSASRNWSALPCASRALHQPVSCPVRTPSLQSVLEERASSDSRPWSALSLVRSGSILKPNQGWMYSTARLLAGLAFCVCCMLYWWSCYNCSAATSELGRFETNAVIRTVRMYSTSDVLSSNVW